MAKLDFLFNEVIRLNGSDLHLEQDKKPKIRINGDLTELSEQQILTLPYLRGLMEEIASAEIWKRFEETGDADFAYAMDNGTRFRANYFRHFFGYGAVFRFIPSRIMTMEELGVPDICKSFCELTSGLVLVTGPTGSGKSSTLAAMIDFINTKYTRKIVTIEEPIEFFHKNNKSIIVHREVGIDTESFAQGLRSALKSDADIILVGEMRDKETIELALTAAEMGILVFGTLHTNSAAKTINRVIDAFPSAKKEQIRDILANTIKGILAQQLIKSTDGSRRWASFEILVRTTALPIIIRTNDTKALKEEIATHSSDGMISMDNYLQQLVKEGKISNESAYLRALDKSLFKTP